MKILVLNCGSSSVKFQLIDMTNESVIAKGLVERIGSSEASITYLPKNKHKISETREILNHDVAISLVLSTLMHPQYGVIKTESEIDGIGHRLVHGGEEFTASVLITEEVKAGVRRCIQFAPLHNPHNLKGVEVCEQLLQGVPQVGVFDTVFHHTIPAKAYMYGLPLALYKKLGIRRYGFHGTSHCYVANQAAEFFDRPLEKLKIITCHLGNGSSIAAVENGRSVDTSMGFTPLEGLVMGTRCGDIDPALVSFIMERENLNTRQIDNLMNKSSGMLGLTEMTNDMREIEAEAERGSENHLLALDIFCYRIQKYIGAYFAALGGADAVVFTGGIGENSSLVREKAISKLSFLGISLDKSKNNNNSKVISKGKIKVLVIPTNEELAIARDTRRILETITEEIEKSVSEEIISEELATISPDDKVELLLLWAENPHMSLYELTNKLNKILDTPVSIQTVRRELQILGLDQISEEKKEAMSIRSK